MQVIWYILSFTVISVLLWITVTVSAALLFILYQTNINGSMRGMGGGVLEYWFYNYNKIFFYVKI